MNIITYNAYYINSSEDIDIIDLNNEEWIIFIQNLLNDDIKNIDTDDNLKSADVEWIDTNCCVPLCKNNGFIKRYGSDKNFVSIVSGDKGKFYLRFWLACSNINSTLNNVVNDIFIGDDPKIILDNFWSWWSKVSLEPQNVGNTLISKQKQEFGIGHIYVWIKSILKEKEPKSIIDKYVHLLKPWAFAHELYVIWNSGDLIINNNGKLMPNQN